MQQVRVMDRVGESAKNLPVILESVNEPDREPVVIDMRVGYEDRLKKLGLSTASMKVDMARKMTVAYSEYLFIKYDAISAFNTKLREETFREDQTAHYFKQLTFIPLGDYQEVPPDHVLAALERAISDGCFDYFEVAKIQDRVEVKDPILFGGIKGCTDRFFIAQWDDDIRFEDLLSGDTTRAKG